MLDLIVLFSIFVGLVVGLALLQQWLAGPSPDPTACLRLLEEWMLAHKLELPSVQCIISVLNRKLQEIESEDWEKLELMSLLPRTELPQFQLLGAELSSDSRDITLSCNVEWPMCLPGVGVSILEKGAEQPVTCHFMIDWLSAQIRLVFSEKNGVLMLSYENLHPLRMGVACLVTEGHASDPERVASMAADGIQQMLMDLQLDSVPLVPLYGHTPSLPLVLVSSPEEVVSTSDDQKTTPTSSESVAGGVVTDNLPNSVSTSSVPSESDIISQFTGSESEVTMPSAVDIMTPISEEQVALSNGNTEPLATSSSSSPPPSPRVDKAVSVEERQEINGDGPEAHPAIDLSDPIQTNHNSTEDKSEVDMLPAAPPTTATPPLSPGWRRNSLENLQEIEMPQDTSHNLSKSLIKGSSSSDQLASPTHLVSSPVGKGFTLSVGGSEAESIYGADERIPSMLVFEVTDSIKVRHIVALSTSHASKLRRNFSNAKKLHVYNDHSFVATHFKNKVDCTVCKEKVSKLFGKQGYVCRDCNATVHKQCHYKIEWTCPSSTVSSMNLIYPDSNSISSL